MLKKMFKIFIVGSPGAGKTTLARQLSKKLNIPHFDLDDIRFPKPNIKREDAQAIPLVKKLTDKSSWIIEGVYILWIENYIKRADLVIFLDTPFYVSFHRVILRYLKNLMKGNLTHGFKSTLILNKNLIMYRFPIKDKGYVTRKMTDKVLSNHIDKVIRIINNQELTNYLKTL